MISSSIVIMSSECAQIAKKAHKEGSSLREAALGLGYVTGTSHRFCVTITSIVELHLHALMIIL
jgi:fumarate hydratase class II